MKKVLEKNFPDSVSCSLLPPETNSYTFVLTFFSQSQRWWFIYRCLPPSIRNSWAEAWGLIGNQYPVGEMHHPKQEASCIQKQRLVMMSQFIPSLQPFSINLLHYFFFELLRVNVLGCWDALDVAEETLWALSVFPTNRINKEDSWDPVHPC